MIQLRIMCGANRLCNVQSNKDRVVVNMKDLQFSIEKCINSLGEKFLKWPYNFFTESDALSYLYCYIFRYGSKPLKELYKTKDTGIETLLVHREYPTSFRFWKKSMELGETGGRGHYDLVVLNPDFVSKHSIDEVIAKNFKLCKVSVQDHLVSAIELKFIVNPLSARMKEEIKKDFEKLSFALEVKQARTAYLIIFNRCRSEENFIEELKELSKKHKEVKGLYIESIKKPERKYRVEYLNCWDEKLRFERDSRQVIF